MFSCYFNFFRMGRIVWQVKSEMARAYECTEGVNWTGSRKRDGDDHCDVSD